MIFDGASARVKANSLHLSNLKWIHATAQNQAEQHSNGTRSFDSRLHVPISFGAVTLGQTCAH